MHLHARIKSEPNAPYLRVKIGNVQSGVNNSIFDVSENNVVVDRGNTVQFICEGNDDLLCFGDFYCIPRNLGSHGYTQVIIYR